jgi:hypothetical protein
LALVNRTPSLDEWLQNYQQRTSKESSSETTAQSNSVVNHILPECLKSITELPPSLLPPTEQQQVGQLDGWG